MRFILVLVLTCLLSDSLRAQQVFSEPEKQVHWAMAAVFGTGWYRVDENRSSYIFRIPVRQTISEATTEETGEKRWGLEIIYPVTLGMHQLDDLPDFLEFDNYSTLTFTPGLAAEYPVSDRWRIRPFIHYGFGYEGTSDEWAQVWYGGVNSRFEFSESERVSWSLIGSLYMAGYKPQFKQRGQYGGAMAGIEAHQRLDRFRLFGEPTQLNWHMTYDYYFDNLNFHVSESEFASINDTWELGASLGLVDRKIEIGWFSFEQIGLGYKSSSNGLYRAITFNLRSPFTR